MLRGPKFPLRHKRPARVTAAFRPTGSVAAKNYASVLYARLTPETWSRSAEGGIAFVPVQKYEIQCLFAIIRRQIPIKGCCRAVTE
jgi:hypothetical protein